MHISNLLLLAGALGVSARPSGHAHNHQAHHDKRTVNIYKAVHKAPPPKTTAAPPPATTTTAAAAPTSGGSGATSYVPFCGGASKRATAGEIGYVGDTGTAGDWGCNIMLVAESIASQYTYTSTFSNVDSTAYEIVCFNKIGPDGGIDGFFGNAAVQFNLAPGQSQVVVFDSNSQGACAWGPGSVPKTSVGEWAGAWVEFDFDNTSNGGWSGADCSSLVAQAAGLSVPGCQVCAGSTCSTILPGGQGTNAYTAGLENADGLGINWAPGPLGLAVKVGYS